MSPIRPGVYKNTQSQKNQERISNNISEQLMREVNYIEEVK